MNRRAMTLVEVMVAIAVSTIVMGTIIVTVSRLMLSNSSAREHLQDVTTLGRLGEQFRRDVHGATAAELDDAHDPPQRLVLTTADGASIAYAIVPHGLERTVHQGDQSRGRESFVLSRLKPLAWKQDQTAEIELSIGRLTRPQSASQTMSGQFSLVAALPRTNSPTDPPSPETEAAPPAVEN